MNLPHFFDAMPELAMPVADRDIRTHAVPSEAGLAVFYLFRTPCDLALRAACARWCLVINGCVSLAGAGRAGDYFAGQHFDVPAGAGYRARISAGTLALHVYAEAGHYRLRPRAAGDDELDLPGGDWFRTDLPPGLLAGGIARLFDD
jgi:hypothetical protein